MKSREPQTTISRNRLPTIDIVRNLFETTIQRINTFEIFILRS